MLTYLTTAWKVIILLEVMMMALSNDAVWRLWIFMAPTATGSKARWAPQARRVWAGAAMDRSVRRVQGRGHIVAASRLQLVMPRPY